MLAHHLSNNQLTGSIPAESVNFGKLYKLWLNNNYLSGEIPSSIAIITGYDSVLSLDLDLSTNCDLWSFEPEVQWLIEGSSGITYHPEFLSTQGHCEPKDTTLAPIIMYLLN